MSSDQGDGGERDERASGGEQAGGPPQDQVGGGPPGGPPGQGRSQPGQPPQDGPGGQPPAGGQPVRRGPSMGDQIQAAFGDYAVKNQIKAVVGVWALIGFGIGLTPILLGMLGPAGMIGSVIGAGLALATGPVIGGLVGLSLSNKLPADAGPAAVVSAVANYVGFVLMVIVLGILLTIQSSGSGTGAGGGMQLGQLIGPLVLTGIPVAIAAGGATALGHRVSYPATREEAEAQEPPARPPPRGQPQSPQQPR